MNREVFELKMAIEQWRAMPTKGKKMLSVEIKKRAVDLLPKHGPRALAKQLGICVSMFYAWRKAFNENGLSVETKVVSATKFFYEPSAPRSPEIIAKVLLKHGIIEIHSTSALIAVCEKLTAVNL